MIPQPPEPATLLDPILHARLIADIEHVCATANIPARYLHQSMNSRDRSPPKVTHYFSLRVARPAPVMHAHLATRSEG